MRKSIAIYGGEGLERMNLIKQYLDKVISENLNTIIFDSTYSFVSYSSIVKVKFFCVDTTLSYLKYLKEVLESKRNGNIDEIIIFSDAYAGFMYSKANKDIFLELLKNKETYNITLIMSSRHKEYIAEDLLHYFDEIIEFKDDKSILCNDYYKNLLNKF